MPAPNAGTIVARPIFKAVSHVGRNPTAITVTNASPPPNVILSLDNVTPSLDNVIPSVGNVIPSFGNVILSLSKDAHQHDRETASCPT